jgi:hypothetical protein
MARPSKSNKIVKKLMEGGANAPHVIELAEGIVRAFGGTEQFVTALYDQYKSCGTPALKSPYMRLFVKIVEAATELGGADRDMSEMSEDDMEREIKRLLIGQPLVDVK